MKREHVEHVFRSVGPPRAPRPQVLPAWGGAAGPLRLHTLCPQREGAAAGGAGPVPPPAPSGPGGPLQRPPPHTSQAGAVPPAPHPGGGARPCSPETPRPQHPHADTAPARAGGLRGSAGRGLWSVLPAPPPPCPMGCGLPRVLSPFGTRVRNLQPGLLPGRPLTSRDPHGAQPLPPEDPRRHPPPPPASEMTAHGSRAVTLTLYSRGRCPGHRRLSPQPASCPGAAPAHAAPLRRHHRGLGRWHGHVASTRPAPTLTRGRGGGRRRGRPHGRQRVRAPRAAKGKAAAHAKQPPEAHACASECGADGRAPSHLTDSQTGPLRMQPAGPCGPWNRDPEGPGQRGGRAETAGRLWPARVGGLAGTRCLPAPGPGRQGAGAPPRMTNRCPRPV